MRTLSEVFGPGVAVIAEVGQNHDGSLGNAHAYIDAAARAGATAVKFQTHIAHAESTPGEPWRVRFSRQDDSRYDYWRRMEFGPAQWHGLADHARERGLVFLSSPFSLEAFELLDGLGMQAWKIGAGEITNRPLLDRVAASGRPVILSSGLAGWDDLDGAVQILTSGGSDIAVLQCTTSYPCPPEKIGLNVLAQLRTRYRSPVGLSDHSGTIYPSLAAAVLGAAMVEVHVAFSRECFGPDVPASITTSQLADLVAGVRFLKCAIENPVDKDAMSEELAGMRKIFSRSVVAARALAAGACLGEQDLAFKKAGTGIPAGRYREILNRRLKRAVAEDTPLSEDDLEFQGT